MSYFSDMTRDNAVEIVRAMACAAANSVMEATGHDRTEEQDREALSSVPYEVWAQVRDLGLPLDADETQTIVRDQIFRKG